MINKLLLISLLAIGSELHAQNLTIESSTVTFEIRNAGITVEGSFSGLHGSIQFNPEKYYSGKVDVSIPVKTIETGIDSRNRHLKQKDYFYAAKYPEIRMTSRFFGKDKGDKGEYRGYFTLHMKGKTGNITMPFSVKTSGKKIEIKGEFELDRRDYEVGSYSLILSDEVKVKVKLILSQEGKSKKQGRAPVDNTPIDQEPALPSLKAILRE